ncbi:hypothetical protein O5171_15805 [Escherichia coli]|nr:hypothetical protein [Escherichia coli]
MIDLKDEASILTCEVEMKGERILKKNRPNPQIPRKKKGWGKKGP